MQNRIQFEWRTGKLYDAYCQSHIQISLITQILWPFPDFPQLCAFTVISAEFPDSSRFPEIPENY